MSLFREASSGRPVPFDLRRVVLAGYTGRDRAAVQAHIEELAAHGVAPPAHVPAFYAVTPDRVVAADRIAVLGPETSGEAEFVLFRSGGELFVGVGSDHTDRGLERISVARSKQLCPKVVAREVWRYGDVAAHWDHLTIRSYVGDERADRRYQEGPVTALLDPEDLWRKVGERVGGALEGVLVFSGTVPLLGGLEYAGRFAAELADDEHGRRLRVEYAVEVISVLD